MHAREARVARAHTTRKLKFTLPGPMTIVDTIADAHYGDRVKMAMAFADLLNAEARGLAADGVDVIQFDEPAFNVYMDELRRGASKPCIAPSRASLRPAPCISVTATAFRRTSSGKQVSAASGGSTRKFFPALAKSRIDQVSIECINSRVPMSLLALLAGKDVLVGAIDVASDRVETAEEVAAVIAEAARHVAPQKIIACTNCGMAPMRREIAIKKLDALANRRGVGAQDIRRIAPRRLRKFQRSA